MVEVLQNMRETVLELNSENDEDAKLKNEPLTSDLIATLKSVKVEEQELLKQKEELQTTEKELKEQAAAQIDAKRKRIEGLKSEVIFLQKKCNELEQALGIRITPIYQ